MNTPRSRPGYVPGFAAATTTCCDACGHAAPTAHPMLVSCRLGQLPFGACGYFWKSDRHHCEAHVDLEDCPPCPLCEATGTVADGSRCPSCGGTGYAFPATSEEGTP